MVQQASKSRALTLCLIVAVCLAALTGCTPRTAVSLQVLSARSGGSIATATATFTGTSGTTVLEAGTAGVIAGQVEVDRTQLTVEATGYKAVSLSVDDLQRLPPTVTLAPLFLGTGMVTAGGQPLAGATVTVWNLVVTTGSDGSFAIEGLAEGSYTGRVTRPGFADATFEMKVGSTAPSVQIALQEGKLLNLVSPARLPSYVIAASYRRTLKAQDHSFDGQVVRSGENLLITSGDPLYPSSSLMLREGVGYVLENGTYVAKGDTAAAAARILRQTCEDLLMLPTTFSGRFFTIEKRAQAETLLGQPCELWGMSGRFLFEGESVTATATVAVGTRDSLAGVPVRIVFNAQSAAFFDFVYDAKVEIVSIDQSSVSARFPVP
jgi:hypothetical protein